MTAARINKLITRLESLSFSQSPKIKRQLCSIIYRIQCADYNSELLKVINVAQVDRFDEMNSTSAGPLQYEIANSDTRIICRSRLDVEFHLKRIIAEVFVSLDNSVDVMWECFDTLCKPDPNFQSTPPKEELIDIISSSPSSLAVKEFIKVHFQANRDFRTAIDFVRNRFTHDDYLIRGDIDPGMMEGGYGNVKFRGVATLRFSENCEHLNKIIPKSDREYTTFSKNSLEKVNTMYNALLDSLEKDLSNCTSVPLTYANNTTQS